MMKCRWRKTGVPFDRKLSFRQHTGSSEEGDSYDWTDKAHLHGRRSISAAVYFIDKTAHALRGLHLKVDIAQLENTENNHKIRDRCYEDRLRAVHLSSTGEGRRIDMIQTFHIMKGIGYLEANEWLRAWDTLTMFEATVCGRS